MDTKNENEKVLDALDAKDLHEEEYDRWGYTPGAFKAIKEPEEPDKNKK